jgi:hypothetical protein
VNPKPRLQSILLPVIHGDSRALIKDLHGSGLIIFLSEEGVALLVPLHYVGDNFEVGDLRSQDEEGERGVAGEFPAEDAGLVAVGEVADAVLHEGDVEVCLHRLDGHEDEAAELEDCGQGGHQDQLALAQQSRLEVLDLQHQRHQRHHHLHRQVERVLVRQVVQTVVLFVLDARELVDVEDH